MLAVLCVHWFLFGSSPTSRFFSTLYPKQITLSAGTSYTLPITFRPLEKNVYEDKIYFASKVSLFPVLAECWQHFLLEGVVDKLHACCYIQLSYFNNTTYSSLAAECSMSYLEKSYYRSLSFIKLKQRYIKYYAGLP